MHICLLWWLSQSYFGSGGYDGYMEVDMIEVILEKGFLALAAYTFLMTVIMLGLYLLAVLVNACTKRSKFNTGEIAKILLMNFAFMTLYALMDFFFAG